MVKRPGKERPRWRSEQNSEHQKLLIRNALRNGRLAAVSAETFYPPEGREKRGMTGRMSKNQRIIPNKRLKYKIFKEAMQQGFLIGNCVLRKT